MVVAPGDQRGARRRAQRGGEDAVVAQAFLGDAVHGRRRDHAAEGAGHAEAGVVGDDQQHVRRALGRHHARRPPGLGLQRAVLDDAAERRVGRWQLGAADRRRGAGRTQGAGDGLRLHAAADAQRGGQACERAKEAFHVVHSESPLAPKPGRF